MNAVKLEQHLKVLQERHDILDKEIQEEYNHHADEVDLKRKKIRKLEIKQKIADLKQRIS
jgi:hypothetical protein